MDPGDPLAVDGVPPRSIAVFRALVLGDMLCAVPALRALRRHYSEARITLVGLPWARDFALRFAHLVDGFVAFPGWPGLPERTPDTAAIPAFLQSMQDGRYDAAIQLHGRGDASNAIVTLFGARIAAGFHPEGHPFGDPTRWVPWPEAGTEVERLLALIDRLGIPRQGTHREFPLTADERDEAARLLAVHGLPVGGFVCIHPGARMPSRRWPVERFATLASLLLDAGWPVAITGTPDEAALCARLQDAICEPAVNLCGRTTLGTLGAVVEAARLVVCNDTGISHVAAGCGTPSVVVSCGADATRFVPDDRDRHRMLAHDVPCRPCMHWTCPIGHPCATLLTLDTVVEAAFAQLRHFDVPPLLATAPAGAAASH